jgi:hypothetical protein
MMLPGLVLAATSLELVLIGGGLYEQILIDPVWPKRPDVIQPSKGGISRGRFWAPVHTLFELALIISLILAWNARPLRFWLLLALGSHAITRTWSALYFIPKALAFERADAVDEAAARRWTQLSRFRFPLEVLTCAFMFEALWIVWHP